MVDVHLNCLNWFLFLVLEGGLLVILIDCIIFLSPFLDVTRMFMLTVSSEFAVYICKSTIQLCMEYCRHVWVGAPSCHLELSDKLRKWICRTVSPSLGASLEPLAHCENVASLSFFYGFYFGRCSSELT